MNSKIIFALTVTIILFLNACKKENPNNPDSNPPVIKGWKIDSIAFSYNWISPSDLNFWNAKTFYLVGYGHFLKTTDSARSWTVTNIDSSGVSHCVMSFINENIGYVYGTWGINNQFYGTLYKTADGGVHWTQRHYDTAYNFRSLKFFDVSHGLALDYKYGSSFLRMTDNGGVNWNIVHVDLDPSVNILFFLGDICYVAGQDCRLLKSVDHGITWNKINTPGSSENKIYAYYFVDKETGFLGLDNASYKTTDGGNHWEMIDLPYKSFYTPTALLENFHFCNRNEGISIIDSVGYIGGDFPSFIGTYVYTTSDGGKHWIRSDFFSDFYFGRITYVTNNFAYCISNGKILTLTKL